MTIFTPDLELFDVSVTLEPSMLRWPEDPGPKFITLHRMSEGFVANITGIRMPLHTGTHVDLPVHLVDHAPGVDALVLQRMCGPCRMLPIEDPRVITRRELQKLDLGKHERLLFRTRNSRELWDLPKFDKNYVCFEQDAASYLVDQGVKFVGLDYFSVDPFVMDKTQPTVHSIFLNAGVLVCEGLDLRVPQPGDYDLLCFPLKVGHGDGAPARVVLARRRTDGANGQRKRRRRADGR